MLVLVVHNERMLEESLCRALSLYGYRCIAAQEEEDVLDLLKNREGRSGVLLLTDMSKPGGAGLKLILNARRVRPDLLILVIAGLKTNQEIESIKKMGVPFIQKPFDPDTLDNAIRKLFSTRELSQND